MLEICSHHFFICLILSLPLRDLLNMFYSSGENRELELELHLSEVKSTTVHSGEIMTVRHSATSQVWNLVCVCSRRKLMSRSQEGGSRCKNVLAALSGMGFVSPHLAHCRKAEGRVYRCPGLTSLCGCQFSVCSLCASIHVLQCLCVTTGLIFVCRPADLSLIWTYVGW